MKTSGGGTVFAWTRAAVLCTLAAPIALSLTPIGELRRTQRTGPLPRIKLTRVATISHDPGAFTQGLFFDTRTGRLYESTGLYGRSSIRELEIDREKLTTTVVRKVDLPSDVFGEGLSPHPDDPDILLQLTWKKGYAYRRRIADFSEIDTFTVPASEGWGIATDGTSLAFTSGSSSIWFLDPDDPQLNHLRVTKAVYSGQGLANLNELEFVNGELWANVWQSKEIARIDPLTGSVVELLDFTEFVDSVKAEDPGADVLNGIAYDPVTWEVYITGKLWPHIFVFRLDVVAGTDDGDPPVASASASASATATGTASATAPAASWAPDSSGTPDNLPDCIPAEVCSEDDGDSSRGNSLPTGVIVAVAVALAAVVAGLIALGARSFLAARREKNGTRRARQRAVQPGESVFDDEDGSGDGDGGGGGDDGATGRARGGEGAVGASRTVKNDGRGGPLRVSRGPTSHPHRGAGGEDTSGLLGARVGAMETRRKMKTGGGRSEKANLKSTKTGSRSRDPSLEMGAFKDEEGDAFIERASPRDDRHKHRQHRGLAAATEEIDVPRLSPPMIPGHPEDGNFSSSDLTARTSSSS